MIWNTAQTVPKKKNFEMLLNIKLSLYPIPFQDVCVRVNDACRMKEKLEEN